MEHIVVDGGSTECSIEVVVLNSDDAVAPGTLPGVGREIDTSKGKDGPVPAFGRVFGAAIDASL